MNYQNLFKDYYISNFTLYINGMANDFSRARFLLSHFMITGDITLLNGISSYWHDGTYYDIWN